MYKLRIMHRDMKLDNILVHFPNQPSNKKLDLKKIDLETEEFVIKIADLGYAREFKNNSVQAKGQRDRAYSFKGSPLMMPAE